MLSRQANRRQTSSAMTILPILEKRFLSSLFFFPKRELIWTLYCFISPIASSLLLGGLALGWIIGAKPTKDAAQATRDCGCDAKDAAQATDALRGSRGWHVRDERDCGEERTAALQGDARNHDKQNAATDRKRRGFVGAIFPRSVAKMLEPHKRQFLERARSALGSGQ